jgi:hypothetical protein
VKQKRKESIKSIRKQASAEVAVDDFFGVFWFPFFHF